MVGEQLQRLLCQKWIWATASSGEKLQKYVSLNRERKETVSWLFFLFCFWSLFCYFFCFLHFPSLYLPTQVNTCMLKGLRKKKKKTTTPGSEFLICEAAFRHALRIWTFTHCPESSQLIWMTWEGVLGGWGGGSSPRLTLVKMSLYLNQTNSCCDPQIWKKGTISGHNPLSLTARSLFLDYNEDKSSIWFTSRPHKHAVS